MMVNNNKSISCGDCEDSLSRRDFVRRAGTLAIASTALPVFATPRRAEASPTPKSGAESAVRQLHASLTAKQKETIVLPWDDERRTRISPNWNVTEAAIGEFFTEEQQEIITDVMKGITSEEGYEKFLKQMADDWEGGLKNYRVAIFGNPRADKFQFALTGRHVTLRADGDSVPGAAFGGPIVYGHAPQFREKPDHPGNVFWYQAQRANEVFQMLDGRQRDLALLDKPPEETAVHLRKTGAALPGIPGSELSGDQQGLVEKVLADLMAPYRKDDVDEVMKFVKSGGGIDQMHLSYYKQGDIGKDSVWDNWRLESPTFVCHFRGAPHIHAFINVGQRVQE